MSQTATGNKFVCYSCDKQNEYDPRDLETPILEFVRYAFVECKKCGKVNKIPTGGGVVTGVPPSADEEAELKLEKDFYLTWARQNVRTSITLANDVLKQLMTWSLGLLGSSAILLNEKLMSPGTKWPTVFLFLAAAVSAFFGVIPVESKQKNEWREIRADKIRVLDRKRLLLAVTAGLMAGGFALALYGLIVGP